MNTPGNNPSIDTNILDPDTETSYWRVMVDDSVGTSWL